MMHKTMLLVLVFLAFTLCLHAQYGSSTPDTTKPPALPGDTIELSGCLQMSTGHYMLTEEDGTVHELSGGARKLKSQVGHQVELTGKKTTRSIDATPAGGASNVIERPVFEVKSVKPLADQCK